MEENNRYLGSLDYFKLCAALLVVAIHTSPLSLLNGSADFVLTRIVARIAVPFFLMVTGYFLLPQYLFERTKDFKPLFRFLKKTLLLYCVAVILYLPVNIYAGQLEGMGITGILRMLVFDGTFYHLWYLPAVILGVLLLVFLSRKFSFGVVAWTALALYLIGLLGDSYYGLASKSSVLSEIYETLFRISSYTRNGFLYAPVFLIMGAHARKWRRNSPAIMVFIGLICSAVLMVFEGTMLHRLDVQRHDSMYLALLPCMFFLFRILLSIEVKPVKALRTISTWIYVIHPMVIICVRGAAKLLHLERVLIENSMVHFAAICLLSSIFAWIIQRIGAPVRSKCFGRERAWIELNMEHLRQNVITLQELLPEGSELMPAVKANAYGHGAVLISKELNRLGIRSFCVATASEGKQLRCHGVKGDILVLGYTHPEQFSMLRKYRLTQSVLDDSYARLLDSYGKKIKVHLQIDSGMHRLGMRPEKIEEMCDIFHCRNLSVEGIYTHLCADETKENIDRDYTMAQAEVFEDVIREISGRGYSCGKIHLLASYGLINYPELGGDYVRIGIALYGILSSASGLNDCPVDLCPVLSVKARIALIKDLYEGEAAGYGLKFVADSNRKIAVLSIGYADGIPRSLSCGHGKVLVNGREAPIIGRICMDQMLVDVTDIENVKSGDIAVIIGKSGRREITAYEIAEETGTITNELLSRLGSRLSRVSC